MKKTEFYLKKGKLISNKEWYEQIINWKNNKKRISDSKVKKLILQAVINRVCNDKVAVMFSGGVDSSLIAKILIDKLGKDKVILISVGCYIPSRKYPDDLLEAEKIAKLFDVKWYNLVLSEKETNEIFTKMIFLLRKAGKKYVNSINVSVGAVELAVYEKIKTLGIKQVFSGLGSEEVFAGYLRHESSDNLEKTSFESLKEMRNRDLVREYYLSNYYKILVSTPFMDESLLAITFSLSKKQKMFEGHNKYLVRDFANDLKLPNAFRKKKAAQYGSRTQAFLSKECNSRGYKNIRECLIKWT